MRHTYTCIFNDVLRSRVWAASPAIRAVWLWLRLSADPEGFVCATTAGIAVSARVELEEARQALELLESPDPDAEPDDPFQGRIIEKVPRGWRVLCQELERELARHEAEKARKRRWAKRKRAANDVEPESTDPSTSFAVDVHVDANPENVDPTKTKSTTKSNPPQKEGIPPTPQPVAQPFDAPVLPAVLHELPEDFAPDEVTLAEARITGVKRLDEHIARLRTGPIGGTRGVIASQLQRYIRGLLPKMRAWEEEDAAKGPRSSPASQPATARVPGFPEWVYPQHADTAKRHGLNLKRAVASFAKQCHLGNPSGLRPCDVFAPFAEYLENLARVETEKRTSPLTAS